VRNATGAMSTSGAKAGEMSNITMVVRLLKSHKFVDLFYQTNRKRYSELWPFCAQPFNKLTKKCCKCLEKCIWLNFK